MVRHDSSSVVAKGVMGSVTIAYLCIVGFQVLAIFALLVGFVSALL